MAIKKVTSRGTGTRAGTRRAAPAKKVTSRGTGTRAGTRRAEPAKKLTSKGTGTRKTGTVDKRRRAATGF